MPTDDQITIKPARTAEDLSAISALFKSYATSLGIDLSFQDFQIELSTLPGKYAPPGGELLLARDINGHAIGCVALRPLGQDGCCEMKRLYVTPNGRSSGIGRRLAEAIIEVAKRLGYRDIKLDTLPSMKGAVALYEKLGFVVTEPYYDTPMKTTHFLARNL